jgi:hypothetical protein
MLVLDRLFDTPCLCVEEVGHLAVENGKVLHLALSHGGGDFGRGGVDGLYGGADLYGLGGRRHFEFDGRQRSRALGSTLTFS